MDFEAGLRSKRAWILDDSIQKSITTAQIQELELESIARHPTHTGNALSGKKCQKLRKGNVPFAPATIWFALALAFWKLQLNHHQGKRVSSCLATPKETTSGTNSVAIILPTHHWANSARNPSRLRSMEPSEKQAKKQRQDFLEQKAK